jgi:hypothetical protein
MTPTTTHDTTVENATPRSENTNLFFGVSSFQPLNYAPGYNSLQFGDGYMAGDPTLDLFFYEMRRLQWGHGFSAMERVGRWARAIFIFLVTFKGDTLLSKKNNLMFFFDPIYHFV